MGSEPVSPTSFGDTGSHVVAIAAYLGGDRRGVTRYG